MLYFLLAAAVVAVDFFTKRWAYTALSKVETIPLIKNVFHLTYVENRGAAFGMLKDQRWIFITLSVIILALLAAVIIKKKNKPWYLSLGLSFVGAGAVGNLIDRIWLGFVVDLFDFRLINFPVFNVADIFVCLGAAILAIYFIIDDEKKDKGKEYESNNRQN